MEKAKLIIKGESSDTVVPVLFNPEQYNISRSVSYSKVQVPGLNSPILQFSSGQQTTLSLSLYFDTQNGYIPLGTEEDVHLLTAPVMKALWIDGQLHAPPKAVFCWGSFSFFGVIVDAKQSYTVFLPSGKPVRSKLDLTFEYAESPDASDKESPFESPDRTKARILEQDGALWRLAHSEYGDAGLWRNIAVANGIHNPRKCPAGTMLKVPPL